MIQYFTMICASLLASVGGSVCGIGGGVIIKPVLDSLHIMSVASVSFLSGFTVLCMSGYSVAKAIVNRSSAVRLKTGMPISIGSICGGIIGKQIFSNLRFYFSKTETVGAVQAFCLLLLTVGTMFYTWKKSSIKTKSVENPVICIMIGFILGMLSSFLGIGGGPFNIIFLSYLFSMETKEAAQNSLFIILFSQISSMSFMAVTHTIPEVPVFQLLLMSGTGIIGAAIGSKINYIIDSRAIDKLFSGMLLLVICICCGNIYAFL